ncbi:MAG: TIR domain-containing protein, partial [Anaerolineae bacterium]|nr:TIR domain-containing protein [Anaerolineae bacterium]
MKLFLSYARDDDKAFVETLYARLKADGHDAWFDRESLPSRGETFLQEIRNTIYSADRLLLIVGPDAAQSKYVRFEYQHAEEYCVPVIPLLRVPKGAAPHDDDYKLIPQPFAKLHAPDFRPPRPFDEAYAELLSKLGDPLNPLATLYGVPPLPAGYIRRAELDDLETAVRGDALTPIVITSKQQVTALYGVGGIGKSTLAAALCNDCDVRRGFTDGVFWLPIGQTPNVAARMGDIGAAFGDLREEYPDEARGKSQLSALLAEKAVLIVLDDVWDHRIGRYFQLPGAPRCRVVITTRLSDLAHNLGSAQSQPLDHLSTEEGVALILARAKAPLPPERGWGEVLRQIVTLLGGHTLAVSLVAAKLDEKGLDYAPDLQRRLQRAHDGEHPFKLLELKAGDKNLNLELSLSLSYDDLTDDQRRRFRALGVFAATGTFDSAAAAYVWGDLTPERITDEDSIRDALDAAEDALDALVRAGLVTRAALVPQPLLPQGEGVTTPHALPATPGDEGEKAALEAPLQPERGWGEVSSRFALHPLLRAYARALLLREGERDAAQEPHFAWYALLHGANRDHTDIDYLRAITPDFENLDAALRWGFDAQPTPACDLLTALGNYLRVYAAPSVWRALLNSALPAAERAEYPAGQANTLKALGDLSVREDELAAARGYYERALPIYEGIGARLGQANLYASMGRLLQQEKLLDQAEAFFAKAIQICEEIGELYTKYTTQFYLADVLVEAKNYEGALQTCLEGLTFFIDRKLPDAIRIAVSRIRSMKQQIGEAAFAAAWLAVTGEDAQPEWLEPQPPAGATLPPNPAPSGRGEQSTLPSETLNLLAGNTVAVMTDAPEKREEWRVALRNFREQAAANG